MSSSLDILYVSESRRKTIKLHFALAFWWLTGRANRQTHPLLGPLGMNQGTTPPTMPQNRVITDMAITKRISAMVKPCFTAAIDQRA